jgi:pyruvate-formate lyase-activating enzyme
LKGLPIKEAFSILERFRKLDLVGVEVDTAVPNIQGYNFFDQILLMIIEYLEVEISEEIQVHFIPIVANAHHTGPVLEEQANLIVETLTLEVLKRDHAIWY